MERKITRTLVRMTAAVFLAGILIPAYVMGQEAQSAPPGGEKRAVRTSVRESLGLTSEQEKALEEFRKARREESKAFREEMVKLRAEMRELAKDPMANQAKIDALIDQTAKLRAEREKAAFRNKAERDSIFTPEQLEKMRALRSRFEGRPAIARRGMMGFGRMGFRAPGRFLGPGFDSWRRARLRALRHCPFFRWRCW